MFMITVLQNLDLEQLSGYKPSDLKECVEILHDLQSSRRAGNLVAVREKYNQHKVCATLLQHMLYMFCVSCDCCKSD